MSASTSRVTGVPGTGGLRAVPLRLWLCLAVLAVLACCALLPNALAPYDPNAQDLGNILDSPSSAHWLGTDDVGRDVLSRLIAGTRTSLAAGFIAVAVSVLIGLPVGIVAGYFGGWVDAVLMRGVDAVLCFPPLILALGVAAAAGPGLVNSMAAVGIVLSPSLARLIRAQVLAVKERPYVEVARSFSCGPFRIVFRHILPNAMQPVLVQAAIFLGVALIAEAILSFLGLGVQPPAASWGSMLSRAFAFMPQAPRLMFPPGIAIVVTVLVFNMISDLAQERFDPRARDRRA
ncbi:ABC transporter permease [Nocardioides sp. LHD-245]|uniref:ABC transporter permease n=1 Tax=Nocardioides sp. LHD-245 TaxID=3051387 RepID=UPI0027E196FF|nr:ABC transporter permease [Nocardioides sp. LHD-245]